MWRNNVSTEILAKGVVETLRSCCGQLRWSSLTGQTRGLSTEIFVSSKFPILAERLGAIAPADDNPIVMPSKFSTLLLIILAIIVLGDMICPVCSVVGLSSYTTDEDFSATFSRFGDVEEVRLIRDKITQRPRGYGFVRYKSEVGAQRAVKAMDGRILSGRLIFVEIAKPRTEGQDLSVSLH